MTRHRQPPSTLRSTLTLHDVARHVIYPDGIAFSAYPAVKEVLDGIGISFDRWQQGLASIILAQNEQGLWAGTIGGVVLSIARQTGKSYVVRWIIFALCVLTPETKVVWTSHHSSTTVLTLEEFDQMSKSPKVKRYVKKVVKANGQEQVVFRNGSVIKFGAREHGFGRGHDDLTILVLDEAQIMTDKALQNMIPAQNVNPNPLLFFMGTPPTPVDKSEVFTEKRRRALEGRGNSIYVEISCDPVPKNRSADEWIVDKVQWGKGNPAYATGRTNENSMLRMVENLTLNGPEGMLREGLGLWGAEASEEEAIPQEAWQGLLSPAPVPESSRIVTGMTVCVAATRNRQWVYVSRAGERADGVTQVELVAKLHPDTVADWLMSHADRIEEVTGQGRGAGLTSELMARFAGDRSFKIKTVFWEGAELMGAYGRGMDAILSGLVAVVQHKDWDFCVPRVVWKDLGGGRVIDGAKSKAEMAALASFFGAYGMRTRTQAKKKSTQVRVAPRVVKK